MTKITCKFFTPFIFLNGDPLFDKVLGFGADFEVEGFVKKANVFEKSFDSEDFFACFELKMAEGHETASVVDCSFVVFDSAELVKQFLHEFVGAFLRYIVDKHFLPDFIFGAY